MHRPSTSLARLRSRDSQCTLNGCTWSADDGKGLGPDIIVDDGGDMTLLIHEGYKAEEAFAKDGTEPDPSKASNEEFRLVLTILKRELKTRKDSA